MQIYTVRQLDQDGAVISEKQVEADSASAAMRQLTTFADAMRRIEVHDRNGERVRQVNGDYLRKNPRRT